MHFTKQYFFLGILGILLWMPFSFAAESDPPSNISLEGQVNTVHDQIKRQLENINDSKEIAEYEKQLSKLAIEIDACITNEDGNVDKRDSRS